MRIQGNSEETWVSYQREKGVVKGDSGVSVGLLSV